MRHIIFTVIISLVFAQHHHDVAQMVDQGFLRLDVNPKDGLLEESELSGIFKQRDVDGDGQLSFDEFSNHAVDNPIRHELFNYFDTNKDGFLQTSETDAIYAAIDHNGDHQVTRHEFDHYYTHVIQLLVAHQHGHHTP